MFSRKLLMLILSAWLELGALDLAIGAKKNTVMPLAICILDGAQLLNKSVKLNDLIAQITKDIEFSNQFKVQLIRLDQPISKKMLKNLAQQKIALGLFINVLFEKDQQLDFEWRLYDLFDQKMLVGKTVNCYGEFLNAAHLVANQVWQQLMGNLGIFNSVIVACQKNTKNNKKNQHIYAFHCTNGASGKKILIDTNTINIAPRWHPQKRLLYYSQYTPKNVRLMSVDDLGKKRIVTNFAGLNLTPAVSSKGQIVVSLSSSGCEKLYLYEHDQLSKLNKFTALTDCQMHAISPSFIDEDHLVFCAIDANNKLPRIAILDIKKHAATFITGKAFCVSPAYCQAQNKIAYCRKINGVMQIFCYDLNSKEHRQLTTSAGDKDGCSWSPCGNYLVFTQDSGKDSRIALLSLIDQTVRYLTPAGERWSFPAWSPCYDDELFIRC